MLQMLRLLQVLRIVGEGNRQSKGREKSTSLDQEGKRGREREGRLTGSGERGFFRVEVEGPKVFKSE